MSETYILLIMLAPPKKAPNHHSWINILGSRCIRDSSYRSFQDETWCQLSTRAMISEFILFEAFIFPYPLTSSSKSGHCDGLLLPFRGHDHWSFDHCSARDAFYMDHASFRTMLPINVLSTRECPYGEARTAGGRVKVEHSCICVACHETWALADRGHI